MTLKKPANHFEGGETKIFFNYGHTYQETVGSVSIGAKTGYVTFTNCDKSWQISCSIEINK